MSTTPRCLHENMVEEVEYSLPIQCSDCDMGVGDVLDDLRAKVKELEDSIESPIVSIETVGLENMMHNQHAYHAVGRKITKDQFIRHLLKVNENLQNSIIEKLQISPFPATIGKQTKEKEA